MVEAYRARVIQLDQHIPDPAAREALIASGASLDALSSEAPLATILAMPVTVQDVRAKLEGAERLVSQLADWLEEATLPRTLETVTMTSELLAAVISVPLETLAFRIAGGDDLAVVLDAAVRRAAELADERTGLAETFQLDLLPTDVGLLETYAGLCATAGFFAFFNGQYRAAKRQYAVVSMGTVPATDANIAAGFKSIVAYQRKAKAFMEDPDVQRVLGTAFRGLDTNFEAVRGAREWQERVSGIARRYRSLSTRIRTVASAPVDELRELREIALGSALDLPELTARLHAALSFRPDGNDLSKQPLSALNVALEQVRLLAEPVAALTRQIELPNTATVGTLLSLRAALAEAAELHEQLSTAPLPKLALGPSFAFPGVAISVVESTVRFASELWHPATPAAIRDVLLDEATAEHLENILKMLTDAKDAVQGTASAEEAFFAVGTVSAEHWYAREPTVRSPQSIHDRAARAILDREALSPWLAYLRARLALWHAGGDQIRDVVELHTTVDTTNLELAAELVVYASLAKQIFDEHPDLRRHEGFAHATLRE
ncbi:MAG: hypothetical protein RJA70_4944, partial [Pseudomonadota bacterium]